jgi:hypothetical protein
MNVYDLLTTWGESKDLLRKGGLLSVNGRVLVTLIADPEITQVAVSVILGISPSAVEKAVAFWSEAGIIVAEKNGRNNKYSVNLEALHQHPDYKTLALLITNDKI